MERLTREADFGLEDWEETLFFVKSDPYGAYNILDIAKYQGYNEFDEILKSIALRLAAYENTGLEPEDILSATDMAKVACALHELNQYKELGSVERLRNAVENQSAFEEFMEHWKEAVAIAGSIKEVGAERVAELVQADKDGRCVVLPDIKYTSEDGESALKSAMNTCYYYNNPVTRYIADAVAEKLTLEADLKGEQP